MPVRFYCGSGSPFAWRVWLALEYKQVAYDLVMLSFSEREMSKPEFLAINPRGKVPTITDGDYALWESAAILEYLDERFPGASAASALFPGDIRQRATVRRKVREIDAYFGDAVERVVGQLLFKKEHEWDHRRISMAVNTAAKELQVIESWLVGEFLDHQLSAADFTLYPYVAMGLRLERRKPDLGFSELLSPRIKAWMKRIENLPYFDRTYPPHWRE